MFKNLFADGKSWRSTISGIIVVIGGVPVILASAGLAIPVWLAVAGGMATLLSTAFGFSQTKDKQVTGVTDAKHTEDLATTPETKP